MVFDVVVPFDVVVRLMLVCRLMLLTMGSFSKIFSTCSCGPRHRVQLENNGSFLPKKSLAVCAQCRSRVQRRRNSVSGGEKSVCGGRVVLVRHL